MRHIDTIISLAQESEFISEKHTNPASNEVLPKETSEYSGCNSRRGWRAIHILRSYRKRFLYASHSAWRDRIHHNGNIPIECGKHDNKFLFKEAGKKRSIEERRQNIYDHLKDNIFIALRDFNLQRTSGSPLKMLYLRYDLSGLKANPDYNEARMHWEKDISEDIVDPERLEEQINLLQNGIDEFFEKQIPEYVKRLEWKPFSLSDTDGIPSLNHVSLTGIISKLQTDWIYSHTSDNYEEPKRYYSIEERVIAVIDPNLRADLSRKLDALRNHYEIKAKVRSFKDKRKKLLIQAENLRNAINSQIIFPIERKQYRTQCSYCDNNSISAKS